MASIKIEKNVWSPVSHSVVRGIQINEDSVYRGLTVHVVSESAH